jgi:MYXO-CTERM domain-containing protein
MGQISRWVVAAVVLGCSTADELERVPRAPEAPIGREVRAIDPLDAIPWPAQIAAERAAAARDPLHAPRLEGDRPVVGALDVAMRFERERSELVVGGAPVLSIDLRAVGREGAMRALRSKPAAIDGLDVERELEGGVTEWWRSLPSGLEHGVTLTERPSGVGPLKLEVAVEGAELRALSSAAVAFVANGRRLASYGELFVADATGAQLPAQMSVHGVRVRIEIDDARATYPLVVDPLVVAEQATLTDREGATDDSFGQSVAIAGDGSVAIVTATSRTTSVVRAGAAFVYRRTGARWTFEAMIGASDPASFDNFGYASAIDELGERIVIGVPSDDIRGADSVGSARVFVNRAGAWTEEATLLAPDAATDDFLGGSVAISGDGTRVLVGAPNDVTRAGTTGSVRVFVRGLRGTWTEEATLIPRDAAASDQVGSRVALSADGTRALVSSFGAVDATGEAIGAVSVFVRTDRTWTEEVRLPAADIESDESFGDALALSADGSVALVGAENERNAAGLVVGSVRVFVRTGSTWAADGVLIHSDVEREDGIGVAVALSADGNRALIGAPWDDARGGDDIGSVRLFTRGRGGWTEELPAFIHADAVRVDRLGSSVDLSSDGTLAIAAVMGDETGIVPDTGSARVLTVLLTDGSSCRTATECASGFCTDGVCCESACGGGETDCQACAIAASGTEDGVCTPLATAVAPTVTCRESTGLCDLAETCSPRNTECPADAVELRGTVCREATDGCDADDVCNGTDAECADAIAAAGTECRGAAGDCDVPETCDGVSMACPEDALAIAGTSCRATAGDCDVAESCSGSDAACPVDAFVSGTECRAASGICDLAESCSGDAPACPPDGAVADGTACADDDACDGAEACAAGVCLATAPLDCDDGIMCTTDSCDPASGCVHDPVAGCDGGVPDAGPSDGGVLDGALADGSPTPTEPDEGCGCSTSRSTAPGAVISALLVALFLASRRRTTKPKRPRPRS